MPRRLSLPDTAAITEAAEGARLCAPSAERNCGPITDALREIAPDTGTALELASGTGQHVVAFARVLPGLDWQPTEIDPARRASIDAYAAQAKLPNLRAVLSLDATAPGWSARHAGQDLIVLVNLLHLVSTPEARTLIHEAALALAPGGRFALYGPFLRDGRATSEGDARFDASLRAQDPAIGYKDRADVTGWLAAAGLIVSGPRAMPANNLMLIARRPG